MAIYPYNGIYPRIGKNCFIAPNATVIGDVTLGDGANVWYGAVLRGDVSPIVIGARTNIQDGTLIHGEEGCPTVIGEEVTVGHGAIIHAAEVGDRVLVGMGAVLLSRCKVGPHTIIGARALVTEEVVLEGGRLVLGMPARVVRALSDAERKRIVASAIHYVEHASRYLRDSDDSCADF